MKTILLVTALLLVVVTTAFAGGQHVIPDYASAQRNFFWTKLYLNGGKDLYCNVRFLVGQRLNRRARLRRRLDCESFRVR
jgi:hypothetical protein